MDLKEIVDKLKPYSDETDIDFSKLGISLVLPYFITRGLEYKYSKDVICSSTTQLLRQGAGERVSIMVYMTIIVASIKTSLATITNSSDEDLIPYHMCQSILPGVTFPYVLVRTWFTDKKMVSVRDFKEVYKENIEVHHLFKDAKTVGDFINFLYYIS